MDVFGTMDDVDELVKCVHERQMRIILDLVMNHTSEYMLFFTLQFYFLTIKLYILVNIHGLLNLVHLVQI